MELKHGVKSIVPPTQSMVLGLHQFGQSSQGGDGWRLTPYTHHKRIQLSFVNRFVHSIGMQSYRDEGVGESEPCSNLGARLTICNVP